MSTFVTLICFVGKIAKKFLKYTADKRKNLNHRRALFKASGKYKQKKKCNGPDEHYGLAHPLDDNLTEEEINKKKKDFLQSITLSQEVKNKIEFQTRTQTDSQTWIVERRNRLTASNFGRVCKMRTNTSCKNTVHDILYGNVETRAMEYGKFTEEIALKKLAKTLNKTIKKCGLFIDKTIPYLAATPGKTLSN